MATESISWPHVSITCQMLADNVGRSLIFSATDITDKWQQTAEFSSGILSYRVWIVNEK